MTVVKNGSLPLHAGRADEGQNEAVSMGLARGVIMSLESLGSLRHILV